MKFRIIEVNYELIIREHDKHCAPKDEKKEFYLNVFKDITDENTELNKIISKIIEDTKSPDTKKNNSESEQQPASISDKVDCEVIFMLLPVEALTNWYFFNVLALSRYRKKQKDNNYHVCPIVFITLLNLFNDENRKYFNLDKRIKYLDNSIWQYYVPVENLDDLLKETISTIHKNYEMHLYDMVVAQEFVEFQSRLMKNSYIENLGAGHEKHIAPFVFHSETEMKKKANEKMKEIYEKIGNNIKEFTFMFNVLLIDDFANQSLNTNSKIELVHSKEKIILELFDNKGEIKIEKITLKLNIDSTSHTNVLDDVIKRITTNSEEKKKKYDILFLDYLLGEKDDRERELGSELFIDKKFKVLTKHKGPMDKYWVLPITSFSKAMLDKMLEAGVNRIHKHWYIFDGADPISTPQLFRYNLIKLIDIQLYQAIVSKQDIINFILANLTLVYNDTDKTIAESNFAQEFRLNAKRLYGIFMHRFGIKEALKHDAQSGSAFAQSVINYYEKNDDAFEAQRFYEYTRKLIYLIGYATHQATPQMYNLLNYIVSAIPKFDDEKKNDKVKGFLKAVRKYIDSLTF